MFIKAYQESSVSIFQNWIVFEALEDTVILVFFHMFLKCFPRLNFQLHV